MCTINRDLCQQFQLTCLLYPVTWTSLHGQSFSSPFRLGIQTIKNVQWHYTDFISCILLAFDCNTVDLDVWEWLGICLWHQSVQFQLPFVIVAKVINWIGHIDNVKYLLWYGLWDWMHRISNFTYHGAFTWSSLTGFLRDLATNNFPMVQAYYISCMSNPMLDIFWICPYVIHGHSNSISFGI